MQRLWRWRQMFGLWAAILLLAIALPARAEGAPIGLILDGKRLAMEVPPIIVDGRTLVPLRAIMEALGAQVAWNEQTKTATVTHEGHVVTLTEGAQKALVDRVSVALEVPAQTQLGRMLVPVRFLVEATGGEVDWVQSENTVLLAVKDEALKARLRVEKANRGLKDAPPELWAAAEATGFQLKAPTRGEFAVDGVVHLEGRVAARLNGSNLVLEIEGPQGDRHETALPIRDTAFQGDIYVADGPGRYTVRVYAPTEASGDNFTMVTSLRVQNVSTRLYQSPYYQRGYDQSGITLKLPTTGQIAADTTFAVHGVADPKLNGRSVWLQVKKGKAEWNSYAQIQDGKLVGEAHLGGGPGLHWVTVLLQTAPRDTLYRPVADIPVLNTSAKAVRQPLVVMPFGQEARLRFDPLPESVPDGYLPIAGALDPSQGAKSMLVRLKHEGKTDDLFIPVVDGSFEGSVPLSMGAGDYELSFMLPRSAYSWLEAATAKVTNQSVQVVRGFRYTAQAIEQGLRLTSPPTDPLSADAKFAVAGSVGTTRKEFPYILVRTRLGDVEAEYRLPITEGKFQGDVALRFGAGTYEVVLYTQVSNSQLSELVRFTVATSTAEDRRDLLPSASIESDHPEIIALAKELTEGKSAFDGAKAIFEWTAQNVRYDRAKAFAWRVDPDEGTERTLRTRTGVCRDYAALAVALLRAAGIPAHVVTGKAGSGYNVTGHAWVEFEAGGRWVEMDPTFASGVVSGTEFIPRYDARYFDPAPDLLKQTHTREGVQY